MKSRALAIAYVDPPEYMKEAAYEALLMGYYNSITSGEPWQQAIQDAIGAAVDITWSAGMGVIFGKD